MSKALASFERRGQLNFRQLFGLHTNLYFALKRERRNRIRSNEYIEAGKATAVAERLPILTAGTIQLKIRKRPGGAESLSTVLPHPTLSFGEGEILCRAHGLFTVRRLNPAFEDLTFLH